MELEQRCRREVQVVRSTIRRVCHGAFRQRKMFVSMNIMMALSLQTFKEAHCRMREADG